ncbi:uncharacterized protein [Hyperolius riggenbachi]|uniref:uncharacterized protein isoform X3 n=1 Tax=Hyperolius riggenbachi TaxID=752182 RepID=UPI0035A3C06F
MMEHYPSIKPLECTVVGSGVVVKVEEEEPYSPHNQQNSVTNSDRASIRHEVRVKSERSEDLRIRKSAKWEYSQALHNNIGCFKPTQVVIKTEEEHDGRWVQEEGLYDCGRGLNNTEDHGLQQDIKVKLEKDDQSYGMGDHHLEETDSSRAASPDYFLVQVKEEEEDLSFEMDYQQQGQNVVHPPTCAEAGREREPRIQRMPSKMFINIAQLIQMVQERPEIYDPKVPSYADRYKKKKAWDEICAVVVPDWEVCGEKEQNIRAKEIQTRWRSLKDCFRRELTLQKKLENCGLPTNKRRKYIHYDGLLFLEPTMKLRDSLVSNTAPPAPSAARDPLEFQPSAEVDRTASSPTPLLTPPLPLQLPPQFRASVARPILARAAALEGSRKNKKKTANKNENEWERHLLNVMSSIRRKTDESMDTDEIFLKSLLPFVRKVPDDRKIDMQLSLMHVVKNFMRLPQKEHKKQHCMSSNSISVTSHPQSDEEKPAAPSHTNAQHQTRPSQPRPPAFDSSPCAQEQEAPPVSRTCASPSSSSSSSTNRSPPSHQDSLYYFDL